jgi:hypothetical protein
LEEGAGSLAHAWDRIARPNPSPAAMPSMYASEQLPTSHTTGHSKIGEKKNLFTSKPFCCGYYCTSTGYGVPPLDDSFSSKQKHIHIRPRPDYENGPLVGACTISRFEKHKFQKRKKQKNL